MSEPFIGQIIIFAGNFAIRGYAMCNGQLLSIAQNTALFSILGTTYGGNGQTTFALPNLQSRFPIHFGQGPGLSPYSLGQQAGSESVTITTNQMPQHAHPFAVPASSAEGNDSLADGNLLASPSVSVSGTTANVLAYKSGVNPDSAMKAGNTGPAGGNQPTQIIPPYLALNYLIALEGIFPSRN